MKMDIFVFAMYTATILLVGAGFGMMLTAKGEKK